MGTGIVANAAALLPVHAPALDAFALGVWVLAATLLVGLTLATAVHWLRHTPIARGHHRDPAMAPFYGAPPMAMLTVGAGALVVGKHLIGLPAAIMVDEILWTLGTLTGLASTILIPYLMFTRLQLERKDTLATWLMPIVPPMVSAATGAGLIAHLPVGTVVTGTSQLALRTHANFLTWASVGLYALLIGAWLTAATRTRARLIARPALRSHPHPQPQTCPSRVLKVAD